MTPERLAELRSLCDAATPGPWEVDRDNKTSGSIDYRIYRSAPWEYMFTLFEDDETGARNGCDARFIASTRTAVPELLAEVERLTHALRNAEQAAQGLRTLAERRKWQTEEARQQLAQERDAWELLKDSMRLDAQRAEAERDAAALERERYAEICGAAEGRLAKAIVALQAITQLRLQGGAVVTSADGLKIQFPSDIADAALRELGVEA